MALEVGSPLGHYDVTALIGEGGMGQVHRDTQMQLGRDDAVSDFKTWGKAASVANSEA